jgi:hypothetical protein
MEILMVVLCDDIVKNAPAQLLANMYVIAIKRDGAVMGAQLNYL